jgi:hypothetical protein
MMDRVTIDKIKNLVQEVLAEQAVKGVSKTKLNPSGPRALMVFHAGIHRLDKALEQVRLIGKRAEKLGLYRGQSSRNLVCIDEVKEKSQVRCVLDKADSAGLEKVLDHSDILILPTFYFPTATKVARLLCDDLESGIVFSALMNGKKILAARDGFLRPDITINSNLKNEIDKIFDKLERFGMVFCPTDELYSVFKKLVFSGQKKNVGISKDREDSVKKLITAKDIHMAAEKKQKKIMLALNGNVTPLAMDLAKDYAIEIIKL